MNIEKLEIKGFGKLDNVTLTLKKGLNIIFGNNEAGKSTVQWFIRAMFFGLKGGKASRDGTLPPLKRFKPWSASDYAGFMEYRLRDGQLYRVGRNFGTGSVRVFDSLFNDVTKSFDASKERGVHFAEKHLGLNEICFDKTVFIRQMETKIGEDGSKELHNRIMNISETGFEDISFKKAQEALKEALKYYVGTEKTSTRPLDKVVDRLSDLKAKKEELISRRNAAFSIENELNNTLIKKNNLEEKKTFFEKLKHLVSLKNQVEKNRQIKSQLTDILDSINNDEEELKIIEGRVEEFNSQKEEFGRFSAFSNEDAEIIDRKYQKFLDAVLENKKLKVELDTKEREINEKRKQIEPILGFSDLGEDIESKAIGFNKDIEHLKKEYEKNKLEVLNERIRVLEREVRIYKLWSLISGLAALIFLAIGITFLQLFLGVSFAGFVIAVILYYVKATVAKRLSALVDEKRMSFVNINGVMEEINKKQSSLKSMFEKVGAEGIEDFLKLKTVYDTESTLIAAVNSDISRLESEYAVNMRKISILKGEIRSKLIEAELMDDDALEFDEELIREFKYGVRRYKGIEPSMNYTTQRLDDVKKSIEKHYKNAASVYGGNMENKQQMIEKISLTEKEFLLFSEELKAAYDQVKYILEQESYTMSFSEIACSYDVSNLAFINSDLSIEEDYLKISEELKNVQLNIREHETLLKGASVDEAELCSIEGETEELEVRKSQLEDINISLKIALDVLTEASMEIQKDFVPILNYKMADAVKRITAERYSDLRADSTLALKAIAPETGEVVGVSSLSGGTVDQMYLALRIAAADMVSEKGEKLPFIMDEVFSQYDDIRTRETFEYLKELSKERQIVFLTCKGRELEIARQVFGEELNLIEI